MDAFRYVLSLMLVLAMPPALLYWFLVHPFAAFWRRYGKVAVFAMLASLYAVSIAILWPLRDALLAVDYGTSGLTIGLGIPFLGVSAYLQYKRRKLLTFTVLSGVPEVDDAAYPGTLLREGIYARVRNPRYLELIFGLIGWSLILNYLAVYVTTLVTILALYPITLLEERELRQRFGDEYDAYCREVPRFIPRR
ncbi:MAG: isoprenylcysteine carboxylmethyltransferase family protein [Acidobacteria bacterium]|nr:MAG: isoprenylcysteine carboxylmethyltransferase family protein [Acidobacteriota bacterium]